MDSAEVSERGAEGVKEIIMLNLCRLFDFVPKEIEIIHDNRDYFRSYTIDKLDSRVNGSLGHTDGAVYVDNTRFRDKYGYYVPWYGLSTGGMTVLNVLYNLDKCFDLVECGINALYDLVKGKDGWAAPFYVFDPIEDGECCIRYNGRDDLIYCTLKEVLE